VDCGITRMLFLLLAVASSEKTISRSLPNHLADKMKIKEKLKMRTCGRGVNVFQVPFAELSNRLFAKLF